MTRIPAPAARPLATARIDAKQLASARPVITEQGQPAQGSLTDQKNDHFFGPGGAPSQQLQNATWLPDAGKKVAKKPLVDGKRLVTGGRYGDTFAAGRINDRQTGGAMKTVGNDLVSTTFRVDSEADGSTVVKPPEGSRADLAHKQYERNEKMLNEYYKLFPPILPSDDGPLVGGKAGQPNPDSDGGGQWVPVTRQDIQLQKKGIKPGKDDGQDGRADSQPAAAKSGDILPRGQADRPDVERSSSTVNLNAMLRINTQVNPTRG